MYVALINAPVERHSRHSRLSPPLGLAYVAAALMAGGHRVSGLDFNVGGLNLQRIDAMLSSEPPTVIGISAMTETYPNAVAIARRVKEIDPSVTIVMGGPHPSILPIEVLAEDAVDYVVVGAGEKAMADLVARLAGGSGALEDIAGLVYARDGVVHANACGALPDPDDLPYPARDIFPLEMYSSAINVLTASGSCPYRCPFCSAAAIWEGRRKMRSPESIGEELRVLVDDYGADYVFFTDDIFTLNKRWVYRLMEVLARMQHPPMWGCATRADLVDGELLVAMAAGGCRAIQFGVESGNQAILDSVKGIRKDQVTAAVEAAVDAGIETACSFMIPFPDDTEATLAETGEFIGELLSAGSAILVSYTTPYPGTYFYDHAEELGLRILSDRWGDFDAKHVVMETRNLSAAEIDAAFRRIERENGLRRREE